MAQVFNGTPDNIDWMHGGQDGILKPDEIYECEQPRANHILAARGARGVVLLKFGDDLEKVKTRCMRIYEAYWTKQVEDHNELNIQRDRENNGYAVPTQPLVDHAKSLGLDIWKPEYKRKPADTGAEDHEKEVLKSQVDELTDKVNKLMGLMETKDEPPKRGPGRPPKEKKEGEGGS